VFTGQNKGKATIERQLAMVVENLTDGCVLCQNGTPKIPQTCWRHGGTGVPPPEQMPTPPGTASAQSAPTTDITEDEMSESDGVSPYYDYIHDKHPNSEFYNHNAYAKDCKLDQDIIPDLLLDQGKTTGLFTHCCVVMGLTSVLLTRAPY